MNTVTPLPFYFIAFKGEQARVFLQGQVTCDVTAVTPSNSVFGCYANPQGRVEAIFYLFEHRSILYAAIPYDAAVATHMIDSLKKVSAFSKVTVEWVDHLKAFGLYSQPTDTCTILSVPASDRRILITTADLPAEGSFTTWLQADFQSLLPHITQETIGQFLPHHLNLLALGALDFKKGCYRGQEIIARMHYRSTIKKHLTLLINPHPPSGLEVVNTIDNWVLGIMPMVSSTETK